MSLQSGVDNNGFGTDTHLLGTRSLSPTLIHKIERTRKERAIEDIYSVLHGSAGSGRSSVSSLGADYDSVILSIMAEKKKEGYPNIAPRYSSRTFETYLKNLNVVAISGKHAPPFRRVGQENDLFMIQNPLDCEQTTKTDKQVAAAKRPYVIKAKTFAVRAKHLVDRKKVVDQYDSEDEFPSRSSTPIGRIGSASSARRSPTIRNRASSAGSMRPHSASSQLTNVSTKGKAAGIGSQEVTFNYYDWIDMMSSPRKPVPVPGSPGILKRVRSAGKGARSCNSLNSSRMSIARNSPFISSRPGSRLSHQSSPRPSSGSRGSTPAFYGRNTSGNSSHSACSDDSNPSSPELSRPASRRSRVKSASSEKSRCSSRMSRKSYRSNSPSRQIRCHSSQADVIERIKEICNSFISWKSHRKTRLIGDLIRSSRSEVVRFILRMVEDMIFKDFIGLLPESISTLILSFVPRTKIVDVMLVSKGWLEVCNSNSLWKRYSLQKKWIPENKTKLIVMQKPLWWKKHYYNRWAWEYNERTHKDILADLPGHIACYILSFLDEISLNTSALVNHEWALLAKEARLKKKYGQQILEEAKNEEWKLKCLERGYVLLSDNEYKLNISWRDFYFRKLKIFKNMSGGINHKWTTATGHTGRVLCVSASQKLVLSGAMDGKVKMFRLPGGDCIKTILAHGAAVSCIQFDTAKMVTGSWDSTLKLWDFGANNCKKTLRGHKGKITCLQYSGRKLVSADSDGRIKIWDLFKAELIFNVDAHKGEIKCLYFVGTKLLTGGNDATIKYCDTHSGVVLKTIISDRPICTIDFDEFFIYGTTGNRLKIWRLDNGECQSVFPEKDSYMKHLGKINSVVLNRTYRKLLFSGATDRVLKIWNLNSGKCLRSLEGHSGGINAISISDNIVATASDDGKVRWHDFYQDD